MNTAISIYGKQQWWEQLPALSWPTYDTGSNKTKNTPAPDDRSFALFTKKHGEPVILMYLYPRK